MIGNSQRLAQRREALVARSGVLRLQIVADATVVAPPLRAVDRIVVALRAHPRLTALAVAAGVLVGSRLVARWAVRLLPFYTLLRRL